MKVAFVSSGTNLTSYSEYIPLAKFLQEKGAQTFFMTDENASAAVVNKVIAENQKLYLGSEVRTTLKEFKAPHSSTKKESGRNLPQWLMRIFRWRIFFQKWKYYKRQQLNIRKVFEVEKPNLLLVYGDRNKDQVPAAIKYCGKRNIPVVVIQIASNNMEFILKSRRDNPDFHTSLFVNFILSNIFPKQVYYAQGKKMMFFPWYESLALIFNGMLPKNPWYDGEGAAKKNLLISVQHKDDAAAEGASLHNAVVVGQLSHDVLHKTFQKKEEVKLAINKKYFLGSKKEIILFGMPQFYEHSLMNRQDSFKAIEYVIENLIRFEEYSILLNLHPKMDYNIYKYLEEKYIGVKLVKEERLSEILPAAEIFVSVFESTISWAIMCEVIPVFLDYYKLGFDLKKYRSCNVLKDEALLFQELKRIIQSKEDLRLLMEKDKKKLPPFDGKSGERIWNELKALVSE